MPYLIDLAEHGRDPSVPLEFAFALLSCATQSTTSPPRSPRASTARGPYDQASLEAYARDHG